MEGKKMGIFGAFILWFGMNYRVIDRRSNGSVSAGDELLQKTTRPAEAGTPCKPERWRVIGPTAYIFFWVGLGLFLGWNFKGTYFAFRAHGEFKERVAKVDELQAKAAQNCKRSEEFLAAMRPRNLTNWLPNILGLTNRWPTNRVATNGFEIWFEVQSNRSGGWLKFETNHIWQFKPARRGLREPRVFLADNK